MIIFDHFLTLTRRVKNLFGLNFRMNKVLILAASLFIFSLNTYSQQTDTISVAFWNLENLFDTVDDPNKNDEEFLPSGDKEWTAEKLETKLYNLSRIIRSMNDCNCPDILGVCEVEHQHLLDILVSKFFSDKNYKLAYLESPDGRGIDNGLIYNSKLFSLLFVKGDTVKLDDNYPTRLVLYVGLLTKDKDTLHVYVNHWPSRRGGEAESEPNRIRAAETVRASVDKNFELNNRSKIIIIGDFNDEPNNVSILNSLKATPFYCDTTRYIGSQAELYNLSYPSFADGIGSYKYRDDWNMLDQIIVSGALINSENFYYVCNSFKVYKPEVMVTKSGKYEGAPFPTFGGKIYLGGYSDHFPVVAEFILKGNIE
jgi:endonuclease/exonuclease/phosphatase family metal-dependent hydrolase